MAVFDLAGKASGRPLWSLLGVDAVAPTGCTRRWSPAQDQAEVAGRRPALGRGGIRDVQAQARNRRRRRPGARGPGGARPGRPDPGRRERGLERRGGARDPADDRAARHRARRAACRRSRAMAEVTAASPIPIAADELVENAKDAERAKSAGGLRPRDREAGEGRWHRRGERDLLGAADLPIERPRRPARDRGRGARRAGARVHRPGGRMAHGLATHGCSPDTAAVNASSTAPTSGCRTAPASESSSTPPRSSTAGSGSRYPSFPQASRSRFFARRRRFVAFAIRFSAASARFSLRRARLAFFVWACAFEHSFVESTLHG